MIKAGSCHFLQTCCHINFTRQLSSRPPSKLGKKFSRANRNGMPSNNSVKNTIKFPPSATRYSDNRASSYLDRNNPVAEKYRADFRSRMIRKLKTIERKSFDRPPRKMNILSYRCKHQIYYLHSLSESQTDENDYEPSQIEQNREYNHLEEHNEWDVLNTDDIRNKIMELYPVSWSSLTAVLHSRMIFKDLDDIKQHDEILTDRWQLMLNLDLSELDQRLQMTLRDLIKSGQIVNMVHADGVDEIPTTKIKLKTMPETEEELESISNRKTLRKTKKLLLSIRDKYSNMTIRDLDRLAKPPDDDDF